MRSKRWIPVGLWLLVLFAAALVVARAHFTASMSAFLPRAPTAEQKILVNQLQSGNVARIMLIAISGTTAPVRASLSRALAQRLRADRRFVTVRNGEPLGQQRDFRMLFTHRYALSPGHDAFSVAALHRSIARSVDLLASPMGDVLQPIFTRDPTGVTLDLLRRYQGAGHGPRVQDGVWISPQGHQALLLAETAASGADTHAQQQAIRAIREDFSLVRQGVGVDAVRARLSMTGPGIFAVTARATIKGAAVHISLISAFLIVVLLLWLYRSPLPLLLGLVPVLSGVLVGIAAVSLGFGTVHDLTLGFGTTLMGEAVDYSIYLFVQSSGSPDAKMGWSKQFWPTVRLGMLTSVIGFAALLSSDFPGLAQLGLYSISGLVAAALVTRFVLPQLMAPDFAVRSLEPLGQALERSRKRLTAYGPRVVWGALALSVTVLFVHRHHLWNAELSALSPAPAAAVALDTRLRSDLGAPDVRYMVSVSGLNRQQTLERAEAVGRRLQPLVYHGLLAGFDSPARYLPSVTAQRRRLAALPSAMVLRRRLRVALQGLPVRVRTLEPFVQQVSAARRARVLHFSGLVGTSMALAVEGMLSYQKGRWQALMPLQAPASGVIDGAAVRAALGGAGHPLLIDMKRASNDLYHGYLLGALRLSLAGLVAIAILLAIALHGLRPAAKVLLPLLAAVAVVAAGLLLAGERLTLLHLIGLMLIVAVGSNYALFFHQAGKEGARCAPETLVSLMFANMATLAGFGPLMFSGVPVLEALGFTVGPGAVLALLFSALMASRGREPA